MQVIPLQASKSQSLNVTLGGQSCQITIKQRSTGVYIDLAVNNVPVVSGARCLNKVLVVRYAYMGFSGDLAFVDTQGANDPDSSGFGARYQLIYYAAADL